MPMPAQSPEYAGESITELLVQSSKGDRQAEARLISRVHNEIHRVARRLMADERPGHTLQASALVNEAYIHLFEKPEVEWQNRAHIFAVASQRMRRILVDHARGRIARKRGGARSRVTLTEAIATTEDHTIDVLALDELLDELAKLSPRQARVVELRYFSGLDCGEIALLKGVSSKTVKRDWRMARAWLRMRLGS